MEAFVPKKQHLREALLFCFNLKKTAAESHRLLVEAYGEHALSEPSCREWFRRFKSGDFSLDDKEGPGQPKNLKMKNSKNWSIKIHVKHFRNFQNL